MSFIPNSTNKKRSPKTNILKRKKEKEKKNNKKKASDDFWQWKNKNKFRHIFPEYFSGKSLIPVDPSPEYSTTENMLLYILHGDLW